MKKILAILFVVLILSACKASDDATPADTPVPAAQTADSTGTVYPLVTFLEIGAESCIPCKQMKPVMKAIEEGYGGLVKVVFHDLYKDRQIGQKYGVRVMPTQIFLDAEGKEFFRHEGFYPQADIEKMLAEKIGLKKPVLKQ